MKELQATMVYSWFWFLEIMHGYVCVTQRGNRNGPLLMARVGLTKFWRAFCVLKGEAVGSENRCWLHHGWPGGHKTLAWRYTFQLAGAFEDGGRHVGHGGQVPALAVHGGGHLHELPHLRDQACLARHLLNHHNCAARSVTKSERVDVQQTGTKADLGGCQPGGLRDPLGGDLDHLDGLGLGYDHLAAGVEQGHRQWAPCPTRPSCDSSTWSKAFPVTSFNFGGSFAREILISEIVAQFRIMSNWPQTIDNLLVL